MNSLRCLASLLNFRVCIIGLAALGALGVSAQVVPGAPTPSKETDPVVLSPFSVTSASDVGYAAGDSLAASRFNTRLMDSAATVSVFTQEFLRDLGANTLAEVLEYGVNSNIDFDQNRPDPTMFYVDAGLQNTRINNRGLLGSSLTDFFRSRMPVDAYNTGRFDFASGPNSVLFGVANSAGSINTSTLQAELRKNHYKFSAHAGRWADYRASVDANVVLVPGRVAARVLGMHARKDSWREWDSREDNRVTGSLRASSTTAAPPPSPSTPPPRAASSASPATATTSSPTAATPTPTPSAACSAG
jgi:outer membrane receptor protein involved in Fe transport